MTSENTVHRHPILTSELQILQTYISCNLANHRCFPWLKMTFLPFCITSSSCHYTGVSNGRPKVGGRKRNTLIWSDFIFIRELSLGLSIEIKRGIISPPWYTVSLSLFYSMFWSGFYIYGLETSATIEDQVGKTGDLHFCFDLFYVFLPTSWFYFGIFMDCSF